MGKLWLLLVLGTVAATATLLALKECSSEMELVSAAELQRLIVRAHEEGPQAVSPQELDEVLASLESGGLEGGSPTSPLILALELLASLATPRALPQLVEVSRRGDTLARAAAAKALGSLAADECLEPLRAAFADPENEVGCMAMHGVRLAVAADRGSPSFHDQVFRALSAILEQPRRGGEPDVDEEAATCLLAIDANGATRLLNALLARSTPQRCISLLQAANRARAKLSTPRLVEVLDGAERQGALELAERLYALALLALAHAGGGRVESRCQDAMDSDSGILRAAGARAMLVAEQLEDAFDIVSESEKKMGFELLTRPQRAISVVLAFDRYVQREGLEAFLDDLRPDRALWGLEEIGATRQAARLREAISVNRRLDPLSLDWAEAMYRLDEQFLEEKGVLDVLMTRYILKNREQFR